MDTAIQAALRGAVYRILRPLARVMLHHGMAYGSFAELARKAFVEESLDSLRRHGKRPTISAVAAMSGLTRKEASRLADTDVEETLASDQRYNRAIRVITAWTADRRFSDRKGGPKLLPLQGKDSFETLVRDYSGDVPYAAMLSTLETSGTVRAQDDSVELLARAYLPTQTPAASLAILGADVAELISSIDHNLTHDRDARVFQRKVSNTLIPAEALAAFRALSASKSQELLEEYHAWLSAHEAPAEDSEQTHYVAVGIYYFDSTIHEDREP
jgi:hypothetical protein